MNRITLCENAADPETWITSEVEDICAFLQEHFIKWPETAKIYLNQVAENCDVTPCDEASIQRLQSLKGHFFVIVYPQGIETILIIVAIAVAVAAVGLSFLLRPHVNTPNVKNQQQTSPNNELSDRQNKNRLGERIPDIYGKVWSTPDLIQLPYRVFDINGLETEYAYMCIGRGSYNIGLCREDLTPVSEITGMSLIIWGPDTSPNGGTLQTQIGPTFTEPVRYVKGSSSINGQTILAPNLTGAGYIGPFLIGDANTADIWFNFTAENGSYSINSTTGVQSAVNTTIEVGITPVDAAGTPTASEGFTTVTLNGSATLKSRIGVTLKVTLSAAGMVLVRTHRTSNTNIAANVSVSDEVKWRDCYAVSPVSQTDFGNITTVQTLTRPTPQALAISARKLNILVTRNVPIGTLLSGVVTFGMAGPSKNSADIFCAIAQDTRLGNRQSNEIDFVEIYTTIAAVNAYFGTSLCSEFCFTFDDSKVSFEEMVADLAASVFCQAFRRGSLLSLSFEQQTVNSTILFNHRNKVPKSETRNVTFGLADDLDGIELTYVEPNDPFSPNQDIPKTLSFPLNVFHIHSTGGSDVLKYFYSTGASINAVQYYLQVTVKNTGLAPLKVQSNIGGGPIILLTGDSTVYSITVTGNGSTFNQLRFESLNIGDELNFDAYNPFIGKVSDMINLIPIANRNFSGWSVFGGPTINVIPVDSSAINPKRITTVGVRNNVQAYILGYRLYNKLLYQNTATEFQALEEASIIVRNDRILVADNTRSDIQDGEVIEQSSLLLTLSQPVIFVTGRTYTIFLQQYDGTIQSLAITASGSLVIVPFSDWDSTIAYRLNSRVNYLGVNYIAIASSTNLAPNSNPTKWQVVIVTNQVILAGAPSLALVVDALNYAKTTYTIVDNVSQRPTAFLMTEKTPVNGKIFNVKAINYDDRYYQNDVDFLRGFVLSNGQEGTGTPSIAPGGTYRPSIVNDFNPASGSSGLTTNSGTVEGFDVPSVPPSPNPPFSDGSPGDNEPGDVMWGTFAPVKINASTTLHVVVSSISNNSRCGLSLNGTLVSLTGAATYTVSIPADTYLSTIGVEATATATLGSSGSESITITDIYIS